MYNIVTLQNACWIGFIVSCCHGNRLRKYGETIISTKKYEFHQFFHSLQFENVKLEHCLFIYFEEYTSFAVYCNIFCPFMQKFAFWL